MKLLLLFFAGSIVNVSTCNKEKDRLPVSTRTEMLAGKTWQVDELMHSVSCTNSHYIRDVKNSTDVNYDLMQFTFKKNGTGTHTDQYGQKHQTSWKFVSPDQRTIDLVVHLSSDINFTWNMVEITDSTVNATVSIISGTSNILESFRLTTIR